MTTNIIEVQCPVPVDFELRAVEGELRRLQQLHPVAFTDFMASAKAMNLPAPVFAILLETVELLDRGQEGLTPATVWQEAAVKYTSVMRRAVATGSTRSNPTTFLEGNWAQTLANAGRPSLLGVGGKAFGAAMGVQEFNASMGLVSAAPTGGASGTVPATIVVVGEALDATDTQQVEALFVAGLVGLVAFRRGPVSGAQAGCGGEVGIAAGMAAGGAVHLLGGSWDEIDAAAGLAGTSFVGLECSPTRGLVEYPCVPRNGFAALCAIASAEAAIAGIVPPHGLDDVFDRIFGVGRLLPKSLRETNAGDWAAPTCHACNCNHCESC